MRLCYRVIGILAFEKNFFFCYILVTVILLLFFHWVTKDPHFVTSLLIRFYFKRTILSVFNNECMALTSVTIYAVKYVVSSRINRSKRIVNGWITMGNTYAISYDFYDFCMKKYGVFEFIISVILLSVF